METLGNANAKVYIGAATPGVMPVATGVAAVPAVAAVPVMAPQASYVQQATPQTAYVVPQTAAIGSGGAPLPQVTDEPQFKLFSKGGLCRVILTGIPLFIVIFTFTACVCPDPYSSNSDDNAADYYSAEEANTIWEYDDLGPGYCADWKYLPEGGEPDHLPSSHALYRADKIQECAARPVNILCRRHFQIERTVLSQLWPGLSFSFLRSALQFMQVLHAA